MNEGRFRALLSFHVQLFQKTLAEIDPGVTQKMNQTRISLKIPRVAIQGVESGDKAASSVE